MSRYDCRLVVGAVLAVGPGLVCGQVIMETVTVGNPGNVGIPWGGVSYVYDIGKYEVTAGQYTEFLNAVAADDKYGLYHDSMWEGWHGCKIQRIGSYRDRTYSVADDWADRPVNYVSWADAARFANWMHNGQPTGGQGPDTTEDGSYDLSATQKYYVEEGYIIDRDALNEALLTVVRKPDATWVIPSEDEWFKAAYHKNDGVTGNYWRWPAGSDIVPDKDLIDPDPGNNATYIGFGVYTIGEPYWRTVVGAHENSESPYGTFDQGGNVFEWDEVVIFGRLRGIRGGSYDDYYNTLGTHYRDSVTSALELHDIGFRLAKVSLDCSMLMVDAGVFVDCMEGPNANIPWECSCPDFNGDREVDLADFAVYQRQFGSP